MAAGGVGQSWEELRREARKLEGDLDVKLASYAKLCSMLGQTAYRDKSGASASGDVLDSSEGSWRSMDMEIEALLGRLEGVNDRMARCANSGSPGRGAAGASAGSVLSGSAGVAAASLRQKLDRHREVLQGFHQEFRRTRGNMTSLREHAELLSSLNSHLDPADSRARGAASPGLQSHLTERKQIHGSIAQIDVVIGQATATKAALSLQRSLFSSAEARFKSLSQRFPAVRNLLAAIRRKRSRDTIILALVIAACTAFLIIYWLLK